jgi:hypothetical protein
MARFRPFRSPFDSGVVTLFVLALVVWTGGASAGTYDVTKNVTWDTTLLTFFGDFTGTYTWAEHAFATDYMGTKTSEPAMGGAMINHLNLGKSVQVNQQNGDITYKHSLQSAALTSFTGEIGFNFTAPVASAVTTLVKSDAEVTMKVMPTVNDATATGSIHVKGSAFAALPPQNTTDFGDSFANGRITIEGAVASVLVHNGQAPVSKVTIATGDVSLTSGTTSFTGPPAPGRGSNYIDPIVLTITNSVTGGLIARQALFDESYRTIGNAAVSFTAANGLVLQAGAGSDAMVDYTTLGSWVLNSFVGSASVANGIFTATGDLAALPWVVTTVGGVTMASLSESAFAPTFALEIQPSGLGSPTDDLIFTLTDNGSAYTSDYNTTPGVPEPSSVVLLGLGLVLINARRFARRRQP